MSGTKYGGKSDANFDASLVQQPGLGVGAKAHNVYIFECFDKNGNLKWREEVPNLVTTEGLNHILDIVFKGGTQDSTWFVGLIDITGYSALAAGDTMSSHAGWTEFTTYSEGTRPALTLGTISGGSVDNSASKASYSINGSGTVKGGFVCGDSTKSGTTGTLYGEALFSGGDRSVVNTDVLNVTVTLTQTSA